MEIKVWQVLVMLVTVLLLYVCGLPPEECQMKPSEKHCMVEYSSRFRIPYNYRYVFNWRLQKCMKYRWANYCDLPPKERNNFESEEKCIKECSGWA